MLHHTSYSTLNMYVSNAKAAFTCPVKNGRNFRVLTNELKDRTSSLFRIHCLSKFTSKSPIKFNLGDGFRTLYPFNTLFHTSTSQKSMHLQCSKQMCPQKQFVIAYSTSKTKNSACRSPTFSISSLSPSTPIANAPSPSDSSKPPLILIRAPFAAFVLYPDL